MAKKKYPTRMVEEYEHRLRAEKLYKRKILPSECVHHIDGDVNNYHKENLIIMKKRDHNRLHFFMRKWKLDYPKFNMRLK